MADDKRGREEQARNADQRQRRRDVQAALERGDETEPPVDPEVLDGFEADLSALEFPATGREVVAAVGDSVVEAAGETHTVASLVPDTDGERFNTPESVRKRVARPTIAASMKRIVEACEASPDTDLAWSQREAYEKTLRALIAIDADDDDEAVTTITDWIVDRVEQKGRLPGSRGVRRQAAKVCRERDFEIRNDEWLGI